MREDFHLQVVHQLYPAHSQSARNCDAEPRSSLAARWSSWGAAKAVIMNWHRTVVAVPALLLALVVSSRLAIAAGLLDAEWAPFMRRLRGVLFGCVSYLDSSVD